MVGNTERAGWQAGQAGQAERKDGRLGRRADPFKADPIVPYIYIYIKYTCSPGNLRSR